ncbi:uncharacterized protein LOC134242490 [Saccostrea cucullata]|uniref:uncharacterized protein LOC134242490 n=1 Tax=Saccostrea cuccullata TaxID=36930 RepID=UPI002ED215A9
MEKSGKRGFFRRSHSLPSTKVKKGQRRQQPIEESQDEANPEEVHEVLRNIKILAISAKKYFKKRGVYRYYCEELIDRWIPDLKRLLRISSREERRNKEKAEAEEENFRQETNREFRSFSKEYNRKKKVSDEASNWKQKYEEELAEQKRKYEEEISKLKKEHEEAMKRLLMK